MKTFFFYNRYVLQLQMLNHQAFDCDDIHQDYSCFYLRGPRVIYRPETGYPKTLRGFPWNLLIYAWNSLVR